MRLSVLVSFASLAALTVTSTAYAKDETIVLTPSAPWNAHFAADKCRLAGVFGEGEYTHVLMLDQHYPSSGATLTVAGPSFKPFRGSEDTSVALGDAAAPFETQPMKAQLGRLEHGLVFSNLYFGEEQPLILREGQSGPEREEKEASTDNAQPQDPVPQSAQPTRAQLDAEFGKGITYLSFTQRGREVRLDTGSLGPAFDVLNRCTTDLIREWGFDVEEQLTVVKRPAWTNYAKVIERIQRTYPRQALRRGESAVLRIRVTVDEEGAVEECVLNDVTETRVLKSPACKEMRKAKFEPALNAAGEPVRSFYTTSITYRIN